MISIRADVLVVEPRVAGAAQPASSNPSRSYRRRVCGWIEILRDDADHHVLPAGLVVAVASSMGTPLGVSGPRIRVAPRGPASAVRGSGHAAPSAEPGAAVGFVAGEARSLRKNRRAGRKGRAGEPPTPPSVHAPVSTTGRQFLLLSASTYSASMTSSPSGCAAEAPGCASASPAAPPSPGCSVHRLGELVGSLRELLLGGLEGRRVAVHVLEHLARASPGARR